MLEWKNINMKINQNGKMSEWKDVRMGNCTISVVKHKNISMEKFQNRKLYPYSCKRSELKKSKNRKNSEQKNV